MSGLPAATGRRAPSLLAVGLLALATVVGGWWALALPAGAVSAEGPGLRGTEMVTVTPSDGLSGGQTVMVSGTGFLPNTSLAFNECKKVVRGYSDCDPATTRTAMTTTGPDGRFPPTPYQLTQTTVRIPSLNASLDCGVDNCSVGVGDVGGKTAGGHHISFAGTGTPIPGNVTTVAPRPAKAKSSGGGLSGTALAGLGVAALVVIALVGVLVGRRRREGAG